ncbi:MAG TPA: hypothetical protein PLM82_12385 [Candidatus Latescibacteria bacterium]|nr:hypothetical protein [Candidatus Latescibacterota bacterium]
MVSSLAISDVRGLVSSGVVLTPEEIIRLNDLAVAIERVQDVAETCEAPRVAWLGNTPIYQRTIAAEAWYSQFACRWWKGDSLYYALAWCCAHAVEQGFFSAYTDEAKTRKEIVSWWRSLSVTKAQAEAALLYVMFGEIDIASGDQEQNEDPDSGEDRTEADIEAEERATKNCPYTLLVNRALAAGLGISLEEYGAMTASRIIDILNRWARYQVAANGASAADITEQLRESARVKYFKFLNKLQARIPVNG